MATKKLARQLGLIRRKSFTTANGNLGRSTFKQLFNYLIVIDFESTCWNDGKRHQNQEIIEFPAVLLDTTTGKIESEFHAYVQPQEHPFLSEFCMELTGIKQVQVDEGVPLKICLSQFCKWIRKIQQQKKFVFATEVLEPSSSKVKLCTFLTWSDWDLGVCLEYECKRKQLLKPVFLNSWIDLRATYKLFYRRKPKGLSGALQEVGIEFSGREHSGLDDSRNTAHLAWKMIKDGCILKTTRSLNKVPTSRNRDILARNLNRDQVEETSDCNRNNHVPPVYDEEPKISAISDENVQKGLACMNSSVKVHQDDLQLMCCSIKTGLHSVKSGLSLYSSKSSTSLGQLQSHSSNSPIGMQKQIKTGHLVFNTKSNSSTVGSGLVLVSTTLSSVNHVSNVEGSSALDSLPLLTDWEDVTVLSPSQPKQNPDCKFPISNSNIDTSFTFGEELMVLKEPEMLSHEHFGGSEDTFRPPEMPKSIVYKSPHTTIYNVKEIQDPVSNVSAFKLPVPKSSTGNKASMSRSSVLGKHPLLSDSTKRNPSNPPTYPPAKNQNFTIHEDRLVSSDHSPVSGTSQKALPSVLTSTVNLQEPWMSGKMTPPLCKCGRRSKRLIVSNNGPNHGKVFYCCPVGKYQQNKKHCGYFRWEQTLQRERVNKIVLPYSPGKSLKPSHISDRNVGFSTKDSLRLRPSMRT
ncbi:ERI1 exoribonuclease 2 [Rhynchocyon petersi]